MSGSYFQKPSREYSERQKTDKLSVLNTPKNHVVKCLSTGAYFHSYRLRTGVLSFVSIAEDACRYSRDAAEVDIDFLKKAFPGFAWYAVRLAGGAQ